MKSVAIKGLQQVLSAALGTKHVMVYVNGQITVKYRYRPNECPADSKAMLEIHRNADRIVKAIIGIRYKSSMTIEPVSNYQVYVNLSHTKAMPAVKRQANEKLRYFSRTSNGRWVRHSCQSIEVKLIPSSLDKFKEFIGKWELCFTPMNDEKSSCTRF